MDTNQQIPLLIPSLPDYEALKPYITRIDQNRYYSNFGPLNQELEKRLSSLFSTQTNQPIEIVTVSNCTLGLELLLTALNLPKESRILVPAFTFVATLTAIIRAGHTPVIADIDLDSWLLTTNIADNSKDNISAVIAVATFGQPQDTLAWSEFQQKTGIKVIIDAAAGFGSQWIQANDIPVVFSMHATKSLGAGEGGFIATGSPEIANQIKQMSNFGINLNPNSEHPVGYLSYAGTNAKLSEYHAAVALASLDNWNEQSEQRRSIYQQYRQQLEQTCGDQIIWQAGPEPISPTTLSIRMGSSERRHKLETLCRLEQISTRRWYQPLLHQHSPEAFNFLHTPLPNAEHIGTDLIGLPFSVFLTEKQIYRTVKEVIKAILNQ